MSTDWGNPQRVFMVIGETETTTTSNSMHVLTCFFRSSRWKAASFSQPQYGQTLSIQDGKEMGNGFGLDNTIAVNFLTG